MEDTTKASFNAPEAKLHFLDYWRIIRIRKTVILAVFLLVAITTTLVTFVLPESFASTVRMKVEKDAPDVGTLSGDRVAAGFDPYWVQDQFETIQSKSILYTVITNLNLNKRWAEKLKEETDLRTEMTYLMLKNKIDVRQTRSTSLIEVKVFSDDRNEAAVIANEIAAVYRDHRKNQRQGVKTHGIEVLEKQLDKRVSEVTNAQARVDELKTRYNISDEENSAGGGGTRTFEPDNLRKIESLRIEAQNEFTKIDTVFTNLTALSRVDLKKAILTLHPDQTLLELLSRESLAEEKMAQLLETYGTDHPEVKVTRALLEKTSKLIDARLDGILIGLKTKRDSERAALDKLQLEASVNMSNIIVRAIERRSYFQAKRDLDNLEYIKDKLQMRVIQEQVEAATPSSLTVDVLDPAEPGLRPVKPNKVVNIALGVIIGLAIGIGLAFFIEYLDTSVKTIDDVERALQAPVLGVIPQNVGSLVEEGPDSPHSEAYRVLRTNIMFSQKDPKLNTVTIVSGGAGEGKSTTIFNLATIFAQNGQRVLIVDSDLRRPSIHKLLHVSNSIGLTNFLLKQNTLEEVIQTTPLATLDFLPSGKMPSSSMGVLSSSQMKELIRELKRRYDWVFFDSPPIMGVSDASILASEVDMVLQVIQYRRYPQPMTIRAKQMIEKVGGNLLGIVLNNINMASDENYYYYSGYYYDYYSKQDDEPDAKGKADAKKPEVAEAKAEIKPKY
jgi:succinoglycan biosynthesis transport protein ExoP